MGAPQADLLDLGLDLDLTSAATFAASAAERFTQLLATSYLFAAIYPNSPAMIMALTLRSFLRRRLSRSYFCQDSLALCKVSSLSFD